MGEREDGGKERKHLSARHFAVIFLAGEAALLLPSLTRPSAAAAFFC